MKYIYFFAIVMIFSGCARYADRVKLYGDESLCENLGQFTVQKNDEGILLTKNEIEKRNIDKKSCSRIANQTIDEYRPKYKLRLCQTLATWHYRGDYPKFKKLLGKVEKLGFADEECNTMAQFRMNQIARKKERSQAIADAINQASQSYRQTNEQLYGSGYAPSVYIQLK